MAKTKQAKLWKRRPGTDTLYENFTVAGQRFRQSLGTSDRTKADEIAAERKEIAEHEARLSTLEASGVIPPRETRVDLTLYQALERYYEDHGKHLPSAYNQVRYAARLIELLGADTTLAKIDNAMLAGFVRAMRKRTVGKTGRLVKPRTINTHLDHLRFVMNRAEQHSNAKVGKVAWKEVRLREHAPPLVVLSGADEIEKLEAAIPADMLPLFRFSLACGQRQANCIGLRWSQIYEDADPPHFIVQQKSKSPDGEAHAVPLTDEMLAIIRPLKGHHREFVFTYVRESTRTERDKKSGRTVRKVKGERHPFLKDTLVKRWKTIRMAAGMPALNWHRLRASAATRLMKQTGNPVAVMAMTGHRDLETFMRYVRATTTLGEVKAMMERDAKSRGVTSVTSAPSGGDLGCGKSEKSPEQIATELPDCASPKTQAWHKDEKQAASVLRKPHLRLVGSN